MVDDFEDFLRAKAGVRKTLVKGELRLYSLYFPHNTLMLTEAPGNSVSCILFLDFLRFVGLHRNLSDQLLSQSQTNVDMSTCSLEAALFYPYRRLELAYFAGKISKNRLVFRDCKKAVAVAYYGSCELLVMGS